MAEAANHESRSSPGALLDARAELARDRDWPPMDPVDTVKRLNQILNHPDVKAAQERLARGYGLHIVK
jgi:hypothetical protein